MKRFSTMIALVALACSLTVMASSASTTTRKVTQAPAAAATTPAKTATKSTAKHTAAAATKAAAPAHEMVDLNSASKEDLMKLPGIGDAIADKIVAGRPFKSKYELVQKGLVNKGQYAKLRGWVVAKQAVAAK